MESSRERPPPCRVVGVAVQPAKWRKHFNDTLLRKAKAAGFELRLIDPEAGLEEQGPFDAVLQKLRRPGGRWPDAAECAPPRTATAARAAAWPHAFRWRSAAHCHCYRQRGCVAQRPTASPPAPLRRVGAAAGAVR